MGCRLPGRFVATKECDAAEEYKQAYINAKKEDVQIIQSPVGMPGRALRNEFHQRSGKCQKTDHKMLQLSREM